MCKCSKKSMVRALYTIAAIGKDVQICNIAMVAAIPDFRKAAMMSHTRKIARIVNRKSVATISPISLMSPVDTRTLIRPLSMNRSSSARKGEVFK